MISQTSRDTNPLTCNFSEFIHLRYLRPNFYRKKKNNHNDLVDGVNKLYQLEVLDLRNWAGIPRLIEYMDNLVSLRYIEIIHYNKIARDIARVGNLAALQELRSFEVKKESGFEITQLGNLIYLEDSLVISGLKYVESKEEAMGAKLEHKPLLSELHLSWDGNRGDTQPVVQADVLEGLKPNPNLIDLTISGYGGIASPTWLTNDCVLDQLTAIKLQNCNAWEILPPLGNLLSLKHLTLRGMHAVKEINSLFYGSGVDMGFQALEEMEVDDMPELKRWMGTNEYRAFPRLKKLWIEKCPKLTKFHPLEFVSSCDNNKNCFNVLNELKITGCSSLRYLSWEGMCGLINLKTLHIGDTPELFSSFRPDERSVEKNFLPQSLADLKFESCDITGKQLSNLLLNLLNLCKLVIINCQQIMSVEIVDTSCFSGSIPFSISPNSNEGLLQIPCSLISTLKELKIRSGSNHVFISKEVFGGLRSIENLDSSGSSNFTSYMVSEDQIDGSRLLSPTSRELSLDRVSDEINTLLAPLTSLSSLIISDSPQLTSLKLPSCTTLNKLTITECEMLSSLEGLLFPIHLEELVICNCPNLVALNSMATRSESTNSEFVAFIDKLYVDNTKLLSDPNCKQLSRLKYLSFCGEGVVDLTKEQEKALLLLTSLEELRFSNCENLNSLPNQLWNLSSLSHLEIWFCKGIKSFPENGPPASLQSLLVCHCSDELKRQCNNITTIKCLCAP